MDESLAGKFLVAMPGMGDPRFARSVIMVCTHTPEQSMGLIVNKPKEELTLGDVLDHLGISAPGQVAPRVVMDGGPVRPDRGFVLHSEDFSALEGTQDVAPGIRLTATRDILEAVAGAQAPERFLLALGCAGWGAGQLESELRQNSWVIVEPDDAIVFGDAHDAKWDRAIQSLGFDPAQLSGGAGRA